MAKGETYYDLVDKYKHKLTTDDCYTPPLVYDAVRDYAVSEYGLEGLDVVRPFYPGGDYENYDYPEECVVIDNPPFSIISKIVNFYMKKNIKFFLFAPAITLFSAASGSCNYIPTNVTIVYENGAKINTSFVTNLGDAKIDNAPSLYSAIVQVVNGSSLRKMLPKYSYPNVVVTATKFLPVTRNGVRIKIKNGHFIGSLKSQRENKKTIFGSGFLISEDDAARIEAARIEAIEPVFVWTLSEEEQKIVASLSE